MVLLKSSARQGVCYVETKNLDGETNLKHKNVDKFFNQNVSTNESLVGLKGVLTCENPND
jgi:magnesium-transporting ATPase (P-type)